ncbi:hypothetical protein Tco_1506998 [Tanacetum coccineum]
MPSLAENVIATRAENRPPMLEKGYYDTWQSRILLYIMEKEHGEMLLDLMFSGPFEFKEITIPTNAGTGREAEHESGLELDDEQQDFMVYGLEGFDSNCEDFQLNTTSIFMTNHVDAFDSDCDEAPTASAVFMGRLSPVQNAGECWTSHWPHSVQFVCLENSRSNLERVLDES